MSKKRRNKRKLKKQLNKINPISRNRANYLFKRGKELNANLPKSEIWFNNQMKFANLKIKDLVSNRPFLGYIPDYRSDKLKLIIEVDGDIHLTDEIKLKDRRKTELFEKSGYTVIRIVAYNENSLRSAFKKIRDIIYK